MSDLIFIAFDSDRRAEVGATVIPTSVEDAKEAAIREAAGTSVETKAPPPG